MNLMTPSEVGDLLKIPTSRVSRLARQGGLPFIELPGGALLFDAVDLEDWLRSRKQGATGKPYVELKTT